MAIGQEGSGTFFVAGGTLSAEAGSYVEREADARLYASLSEGKFCYVLNSRQMGKSSLCVRTMKRLEGAGIRTAFVDLQRFGTNLDPERWYAGVLSAVAEGLLLSANLDLSQAIFEYWRGQQAFGPVQRWTGVLQDVVLPALGEQRLVVFIDEIDFVRSLPFDTDEFFAAIREWYNRRARDPEFNRLSFCLLGVAIPTDLISSPTATPFNIGERIYLKDFTLEEAIPLADGFANQPHHQPLLQRVFHWTNGHPYLTQSLCVAIAADAGIRTPADVDALVERDLFEPKARETNINLADVANRALHAGDLEENPEKFRADLLSAYEKAWKGKPLADDESNRVAALLKLSGIMRSEGNQLKVRNRIYVQVFNRAWVRENMPGQELRRQRRSFYLGVLRTTGIAIVVIAAIGVLAWKNSKLAERNARLVVTADGARDKADYEAYVAEVNEMKMAYDGNDLMLLDRLLKATASSPYRNLEWDFWNAARHDTTHTIDYPVGIGFVLFSSDGKSLGIQDLEAKSAAIYSVSTLKRLAAIPNVSADDTLFCTDGRWLFLNGADDANLRVRDAITSRPLYDLRVRPGAFEGWWISALGQAIVAKWRSRTDPNAQDVTVWDARSGHELHTYHSLDGRVNTAAVSDDGSILAYAAVNSSAVAIDNYYGSRTAIVRDLQHGNARLDELACGGRESDFALSSDGRYLSFGASTGRIMVRDVRKKLTVFDRPLDSINGLHFSRSGNRLLVTTNNLAALLFQLPSPEPVAQEKGAYGAAVSPDGRLFAVSGLGTRIYDGSESYSSRLTTFPNTWGFLEGFNSAGKLVAATGQALRQIDLRTHKEDSKPISSDVSRIAVSQDCNWYLMRASDDSVAVESTVGRVRLCHIPIWNSSSYPFDVTLDRGKVAALDNAGVYVYAFDAHDGKQLWRYRCSNSVGTSCRWSPSGDCLAVGQGSGTTLILDSTTGSLVKTLRGPNNQINQLAFSPDGRRLATASYDVSVYIFSMRGMDPPVVARGHGAQGESVAFSPDGLRVLTASDDGTVRAWDARTGRQVLQIGDGKTMQCSAIMDPSVEHLFTSDFAGNVYMYPLHPKRPTAQSFNLSASGGSR